MKIYTKTGDRGETALFGGMRVRKDHPRVAAYGTVDELNAHLGTAAAHVQNEQLRAHIRRIQHQLFFMGAQLAADPTKDPSKLKLPDLTDEDIAQLEEHIDRSESTLEPLTQFILPGGSHASCALHVARTVCRRAERAIVLLAETDQVDHRTLVYINRLSDLLFSWARYCNQENQVQDEKVTMK